MRQNRTVVSALGSGPEKAEQRSRRVVRAVAALFAALLPATVLLFAPGFVGEAFAACPCSIWPGPVTPGFAYDNPNPIEMGLKFRSDSAGYVTGVRFYKAAGATDTHIGRLWTMGGVKLAEVTLTNETASGWQTATFPTPVAIQANTTYIISYYAGNGNHRFSDTFDYFATAGVDNPPLHALAAGVDGPNSVYSDTGGFFNQTSRSSNYWVDLVFDSTPPPPDTTPPTVSSTVPATGATGVLASSNLSVTFNEAMNESTVNGGTFELRDPSNDLVAATVTYNAGSYTATLDPSSSLVYNTTYTARVASGSTGVKDIAGNALAADYTWTFTTEAPDVTPPTVTSVKPINGITKLRLATRATAYFSEAMDSASITSSTFELRDASNNLVPATVSYDSGTVSATVAPASSLGYSATYTARIKGGPSGVKDAYNNAMAADYVWSFGTVALRPPVDQGPGGPILVIASSGNLYTRYFAEIVRTEGFNEFAVADISGLTLEALAAYDVAILGDMPLTADQVTMLTIWVTGGGHLIAMHPDKQLAGLLGLTDAVSTLTNGYVLIDTTRSPGTGIVGQTLQFHGTADAYTLSGATSLATLYSDSATPTPYPAVTLRTVGSNGGAAAAFTFDLSRSIVFTHQGNPAWQIGHVNPYQGYGTAVDLFWPDWIDFGRITIPQADEQQRFLANLILYMNADRKPLPRFWYFPNGKKAAIILTGDDHWGRATPSGNSMVFFDRHKSQSPVGCSVADWECVRSSSYGYDGCLMTDAQAASYTAQGFEFGLHADSGLASGGGWCGTWPADMPAKYGGQFETLMTKYASIPVQGSERNHCYAWFGYVGDTGWQGYTGTPEVEANLGIRLDTNISYNPAGWASVNPGYQMGSGMLMRFAKVDNDGVMKAFLDIHNAGTQMNDDNGQGAGAMRGIVDAFLDNATGAPGYYGAFVVNMHSDNWYGWSYDGSDQIVASAQAHGIPVVSGTQMVDWLNGRNSSSFGSITWDGVNLGFTVTAGDGARNLQAMVPASVGGIPLGSITRDGRAQVPYTRQTIKGIDYYFFPATAGTYAASYAPDRTSPAISGRTAEPGSGQIATIRWTTDELANSRVDYGTQPGDLSQRVSDGALVAQHTIVLTGLIPRRTYYFRVTSEDESHNSATSPDTGSNPDSFTTLAPSFIDTTVADFSARTTETNTYISQMADGEVVLLPTVGEEFSGTALPGTWTKVSPGGTATVGSGSLSVDGATVGTSAFYTAGRSVEAVATFQGVPFQHVGFGINYTGSGDAWAIISTGSTGAGLMARCYTGVGSFDTQSTAIPGSFFGAPHRYRVDWKTDSIDYYVDGVKLVTHDVAVTASMRPLVADSGAGGAVLSIDWLRMSPYPASGAFESRVFDAGNSADWLNLMATSSLPAGGTVSFETRTSDTSPPESGWSTWAGLSGATVVSPNGRYLQYRATLATTDANVTPELHRVELGVDACIPEVCDGLDNDCDGTADDGDPGGGVACTTTQPGVCAEGTTHCVSGALTCVANVPPATETCNGLDDDCDGVVDNGNPGGGGACSTGQYGECAAGTEACIGGALSCVRNTGPVAETCDGRDNDCDGNVDNGDPGGGAACSTGELGVCAAGTRHCVAGILTCVSNVLPVAETCNGLDDDCDGTVDDGLTASLGLGPEAFGIPGAPVAFPVQVGDLTTGMHVYSADMEIVFNPAVLHATTVDPGSVLTGKTCTLTANLGTAGHAVIGIFCESPLVGSGPLAIISFQVATTTYGEATDLVLQSPMLNEGCPATIPQSSRFTVRGPEICDGQDNDGNGTIDDGGNALCDDGNACDGAETCGGTQGCRAGTPVICNDSNACTDDTCNPANGACIFTPNDANACTDGNVCTNDACSAGQCVHTPSGACGVSGTVYYYRDNAAGTPEPSSKPVPNVGIALNGSGVAEDTTGSSGAYAIGNLSGNATLSTLPKYGSMRAADHNGAISSLDASLIARKAVNLVTFSANQVVAGDVTGDGSIGALDASNVARFAVGVVNHFPIAETRSSDWAFFRCDTYGPPTNPGCGSPSYAFTPITQPETGKNFYGVLYGDVTGNWQPSGGALAMASTGVLGDEQAAREKDLEVAARLSRDAAPMRIERGAGTPPAAISVSGWKPLRAGEQRLLTVDLRNSDGILGLDLTMQYDPSRVEIVAVEATGVGSALSLAQGCENGTCRIAAYGIAPLSGSGPVLTVTVKALRDTARLDAPSIGGAANEGAIPMRGTLEHRRGTGRP